jgi:hypothetical protein
MRPPGHYDPLKNTAQIDDDLENEIQQEHDPHGLAPTVGDKFSIDAIEERLNDKRDELQAKVDAGLIDAREMVHRWRQFDADLVQELNVEERQQSATHEPGVQHPDQKRDDQGQSQSPSPSDSHAEALQQRVTGGGELTEAQQARLERLMNSEHFEEHDLTLEHDGPSRGGRGMGGDH